MRTAVLVGLLFTAGCDRLDGEGVFVGEPCDEQRVTHFVPDTGSVEGYVAGPVWLDFVCSAPDSSLTVTRSDGRAAPGIVSLHHRERQVRWRPTERLNPQTQYLVHYESPDGVLDWAYTTNAVGAPTNNRVRDTALALFPTEGELLDPPGLDDLLMPALDRGFFPVLQFTDDPGGPQGIAPVVLGGRAQRSEDAEQDESVRTWSVNAEWDNPLVGFGPLRLSWPLRDFDFVVENLRVGGGIASDLGWGAGFSFEGWWDVRPAAGLVEGGWQQICADAEAEGTPCTECSDNVRSCLRFELVMVRGAPWSGTLVDVE